MSPYSNQQRAYEFPTYSPVPSRSKPEHIFSIFTKLIQPCTHTQKTFCSHYVLHSHILTWRLPHMIQFGLFNWLNQI